MSVLHNCKGNSKRLATSLLVMLFTREELKDVNVNGKGMNGQPGKKELDPERNEIIKMFCLDNAKNDEVRGKIVLMRYIKNYTTFVIILKKIRSI